MFARRLTLSSDLSALLSKLNALSTHNDARLRRTLDESLPAIVARAPGRLEVMGGVGEYSGSLVLEMPIQQAAFACVQLSQATPSAEPNRLELSSVSLAPHGDDGAYRHAVLALQDFAQGGSASTLDSARYSLARSAPGWCLQIAGTLTALLAERGLDIAARVAQRAGPGATLRILVVSSLPEASGASSSAVAVATLQALNATLGLELDAGQLALVAQTVDERIAAAPRGAMVPLTSALATEGSLMKILCQPGGLEGSVRLPSNLELWGVESLESQTAGGADFASMRTAALMGYRIIAEHAGLPVRVDTAGELRIDDPVWRGYLANLSPALFEQRYCARLPERVTGAEFLDRWHGVNDSLTRIDPARSYPVRSATAHPVHEHFRASTFCALLESLRQMTVEKRTRANWLLGELMLQSHAGYSSSGACDEQLDIIVDKVRAAGPAKGLYGAKLSGGAGSKTVVILGERDAVGEVERIAKACTADAPVLFTGSSPGAADFGYVEVTHNDNGWTSAS
jgi:galactokinase